MGKKDLTPLNVESPEKFKGYLNVLWDELYWAKFHYDMFKEVSRLSGEYHEGVKFSPVFWRFTSRAHCQTALVYLHRLYDQNKDSFNLHRFLLAVQHHPEIFDPKAVRKRLEGNAHAEYLVKAIGTLDTAQLDRDITFASNDNKKVLNLNRWRDRITFHKDERELFRSKPFDEEYPLPFSDIDELIEIGFGILNRYSEYFDTSKRSAGCNDWKDMQFVFEGLMHHPKVIIYSKTEALI